MELISNDYHWTREIKIGWFIFFPPLYDRDLTFTAPRN